MWSAINFKNNNRWILYISICILFLFICTSLFNITLDDTIKPNYLVPFADELSTKPTNLEEWKRMHYLVNFLNNEQNVLIYVTPKDSYKSDDSTKLKYKFDKTLAKCEVPCIWNEIRIEDLTSEELKTADAIFYVNQPAPLKSKAWKGQKFIQYTLESATYYPQYHDKNKLFDIHVTFDEDSDVPTSFIRDPEKWRTKQPFDMGKLPSSSPPISLIASQWTDFRKSWIPTLKEHIPIASFGSVHWNTNWDIHPECADLNPYEIKNCIISKYPFHLSIELSQEKDYSTEKLWDVFNSGSVPIIWGAPNSRSYLPHPKSAIFIDDFPDVRALADHLKYLIENNTAYLEYHQWRTMKEWSEGFERKVYMNIENMECNVCKEVARLRILEGRGNLPQFPTVLENVENDDNNL
ncbi:Glycosyltransferase Family 10 protein [Gigaspora rosea]|uniref:Fucosyltransferase n=1 Tax=Gigaspora rosea TaxID=44941 RepID=A0A397W6R9_9GLOM|nr:Glycosyltransferase Family 10 protein [Gigaspora rosea]